MPVPKQKPGRSEQVVCTPPELLNAIRKRLNITDFACDLAASYENKVCKEYYDEETDALSNPWTFNGWNWCNPPYEDIEPWVAKATLEAKHSAQTVMLVPASVGSNWWVKWVEPSAYVTFLAGRVTFIGHKTVYPKDLALLLYTPWGFTGHEIWKWKL